MEDGRSLIGQYYIASGIDQLFIDTMVRRIADVSGIIHGTMFESFRPEIVCIIELVFYINSVNSDATPAMKMFGLSFAGCSNSSKLIMICCILLRAVLKRFQLTSIVRRWRSLPNHSMFKKVWKLLQLIDVVSGLVSMGNMFQFFSLGMFPTIMHRVSGLSVMKPPLPYPGSHSGASSLELHSRYRQLLWIVLTGCFTAGSLNYQSMLATLHDFLAFISHDIMHTIEPLIRSSSAATSTDGRRASVISENNITSTARQICCVCRQSPPENPYVSSCGHVYCYVCMYFSTSSCGASLDALEGFNDESGDDHTHSSQPVPDAAERRYQCHSCNSWVQSVRRL